MTDSGMDDLISRALALEVINAVKGVAWSQSGKVLCGKMFSQIKDLPAVEAVPVIRCRDCMYWKSDMLTHFWKPCDVVSTDKDWYCPCGKRR